MARPNGKPAGEEKDFALGVANPDGGNVADADSAGRSAEQTLAGAPERCRVTAIDRCGVASPPAVLQKDTRATPATAPKIAGNEMILEGL